MCQPGPVGLREVSRMAGVHPHSAELALAALIRKGLVKRKKRASRALYVMDRSHEDVVVLESVFTAATQGFIRVRSRLFNERARVILPFIGQASRMLVNARETRHVA